MSAKMEALNELAKKMSELKADKYKSRKGRPKDEEVTEEVSSEEDPELEIEVVELEEGEDVEEDDSPKSFSEILAQVAKAKNKKH